jgi:hypothetical protein
MKQPYPKFRKLRVFAFDPLLSVRHATFGINEVTLHVPWEHDVKSGMSSLKPGPIGDYIEVVDFDPASSLFYEPVDLNDPRLLAQDGLAPSDSNPQFHQQMVYAVAMFTIRNFEEALGRCILWSPRRSNHGKDEYVPTLRIYPHGLREANAYYSPSKKALLFGYFPYVDSRFGDCLPGNIVFTCLSHDIIAHELTHAMLDGLHRRYIEPTNPDVLAFHEAFADIVALLQHFSLPGILEHVIAQTRGDLSKQNMLAQLAQQFGEAIGSRGALRDALGEYDKDTNVWHPVTPDPSRLEKIYEPHERGSILVAALFDAFLTIYKSRIKDLLRIASNGTGVLPPGDIHPDLVKRMAHEASKAAKHLQHICIRALDYCPPIDITFGDFLRAMITADYDMVPVDTHGYRVAVIESFMKWGIYPLDVRNLSQDSLLWKKPTDSEVEFYEKFVPDPESVHNLSINWKLWSNREVVHDDVRENAKKVHEILTKEELRSYVSSEAARKLGNTFGLAINQDPPFSIIRKNGWPTLEVHSVRPAIRHQPDGGTFTDLVIEITQRRYGYFDPKDQEKFDKELHEKPKEPDFIFRGGTTLLIDFDTGKLRYVISKRIASDERLKRQRAFLQDPSNFSFMSAFFEDHGSGESSEPFALLHRNMWERGE